MASLRPATRPQGSCAWNPTPSIMKAPKSLLILLVSLITGAVASGAVFLKFDGVEGEAKDSAHKGWIDVLSVSGLDTARTKGEVTTRDIVVVRELDKSSTKMAQSCARGTNLGGVSISNGDSTYELQNATVVSCVHKGSTETLTLRSSSITVRPNRIEMKAAAAAPANHNTTRSNKLAPAAAPETESSSTSKAQDYNSSRSNRTT